MYKIDSNGSVTSLPAPAALGTEGFWSEGNDAIGQLPTEFDADYENMVQGTLLAPIDGAGVPHSKSDYSGLYQAILSDARQQDTGAVNALAVVPRGVSLFTPPASASLPDGFTIRVKAAATTTSTTPTLQWNGGSLDPITDQFGSALAIGAIVIGAYAELMKEGGGTPVWRQLGSSSSAGSGVTAALLALAALASGGSTGSTTGGAKTGSWTFQGTTYNVNYGGADWHDAGSFPAGAAEVCTYLGYNPTTGALTAFGLLGATSNTLFYTGPRLPTGCAFAVLVWSGLTVSGNLPPTTQVDRDISFAGVIAASGLGATSPTSVSISTIVPPAAIACSGWVDTSGATSGSFNMLADNIGTQDGATPISSTAGAANGSFTECPCGGLHFYYEVIVGGGGITGSVGISKYRI